MSRSRGQWTQDGGQKRDRRKARCPLSCVLCLLPSLLVSCTRAPKQAAPATGPEVPVSVSRAVEKTVPVQVRAVGRAQAYTTVSVKSRVDSLVTAVHFKDGQYVKAGDLLFSLDAAPYEAQLKQALANRAKDQAQLENARKQLERNAAVVAKGYVSREQYDQAVAGAAALEATVKADEAAIEVARLQVQYCSIVAPVTGRAGAVEADAGNLVKANDVTGVLVVINQVQPIYVSFYVPESVLPQIRKYMALKPLPAEATIPGHEDNPVRGELSFLNNTVNTAAGTIELWATFANESLWLWPGQFANVVLTLTSLPNAVVVPSQAIQTGQQGEYVFVVTPDLTAEYRPIVTGTTVGNETVVEKGVRPGENVVTDGQLRLSNGAHVRIVPPGTQDTSGTPETRSTNRESRSRDTRKFEIRNPKSETSTNVPNPKLETGPGRATAFGALDFEFVSNFAIRDSNFRRGGQGP
jgi:multidrug efflux system membrane fusion protein